MKRIVFDVESMIHLFVLSVLDIDKGGNPQSFATPADAYAFIKSQGSDVLWIGYNSNSYDDYLMDMVIKTRGMCTAEELRELSDSVIERQKTYRKQFLSYDVFDPIEAGMRSLKMYCGSMGNSTYDSPYSFREDRHYTKDEIKSICAYCEEDVLYTAQLFKREYPYFEAALARLDIMEDAGYEIDESEKMRFVCCSSSQFARAVFEKLSPNRDDMDDMRTTIKFAVDYESLHADDTAEAYRFYKSLVDEGDEFTADNQYYASKVAPMFKDFQKGLNIQLGFGGIHGALDGYAFNKSDAKGKCVLYGDVTSMYPTFMINHNLYPHTFTDDARELYEMAYKGRITYKENGDIAKSAACKRILNSLTGMLKDKYAKFRAPWANNSITINGQLSLLCLSEWLREANFRIIQVNTDGVIVECDDTEEMRAKFKTALGTWEKLFKAQIKMKEVELLIQTDVNNYIMRELGSDEYTRKGITYNFNATYFRDKVIVKKLLPRAISEYMLQLEPIKELVEEALESAETIEDFFILLKVTDTFPYLKDEISGKVIESRCVRCVAARSDETSRAIAAAEGIEYVHYIKMRGNREMTQAVSLFPDVAIELPADMNLYDHTVLYSLIDTEYYAKRIQDAVWNFYDYSEAKPRQRRTKKCS